MVLESLVNIYMQKLYELYILQISRQQRNFENKRVRRIFYHFNFNETCRGVFTQNKTMTATAVHIYHCLTFLYPDIKVNLLLIVYHIIKKRAM